MPSRLRRPFRPITAAPTDTAIEVQYGTPTMLKANAWPLSEAVPDWQAEARGFRAQARRKYRPSMRRRIDVSGLYADALYAMPETMDGQGPLPVPAECPVTLDELLNLNRSVGAVCGALMFRAPP